MYLMHTGRTACQKEREKENTNINIKINKLNKQIHEFEEEKKQTTRICKIIYIKSNEEKKEKSKLVWKKKKHKNN